ncbi:hypothetical protein EZ456_02420 [Pedobacter psychrodurus]|uniref:Uncharacterized protein n=1 Tax=Pedobacter psychrodurus TaxID=2530456 RepID=A0A4R0Q3G7_9SPHI|nr:hypothetical protein [Pedobacter psychrodurus]TCD29034.1 hypothetical protein EZ456_02420 [Pedobacter psychrodurus]
MICTFASRMKILVYLLSLSILFISCITCEDLPEFGYDIQTKVLSAKISKTESSADKDNCSPMCTCNCCGQPSVSSLAFSSFNFLKNEPVLKLNTPYSDQFISSYLQHIWQPPKLNKTSIG